MPSVKRPRRGSLQFWPRKRAKRIFARTSSWPIVKDLKPLGFAGWKAGMTHIMFTDNNPKSPTKGKKVSKAVTIIEAPSLLVCAARFYLNIDNEIIAKGEKWSENLPKDIKKGKGKIADSYDNINLIVCTQPEKSNMKKKTREMFEIAIGGPLESKMEYVNSVLGKEINANDIFDKGEYVEVSAVTKGYGFTGPVKRFGIKIQRRKDKQMHRHTGSIGSVTPRKVPWTIPLPGQYGFFNRTESGKRIISIGDNPEDVNQKGGIKRYGILRSNYILIEGSVPGPTKRLIRFRKSFRFKNTSPIEVERISTESKQGAR